MVFDFDDKTIGCLNFVFQEAANQQIVSINELRKKIANNPSPNLELFDSFMQSTYNLQTICNLWKIFAVYEPDREDKQQMAEVINHWLEFCNDLLIGSSFDVYE